MATTLRDLRAAVARKCEDWIEIEATGDGSVSVIFSSIEGVESSHYYRGTEILPSEGTVANLWQKRRVASSDDQTFSLTLASPLPAATMTGDIFQAFNIGGVGTRIRTYDARINDSILGLGAGARILATEDLADAWDADVPVTDVPANFTHIASIIYTDSTGMVRSIPMANSSAMDFSDGWWVDMPRGKLYLTGAMSRDAHGQILTINGATEAIKLTTDLSTTTINYDWLVLQTASQILLAKESQIQKNLGGMYANMADSLRAVAVMPTPEGMVRIR